MNRSEQRLRETLAERTPISAALIDDANVVAVAHSVARKLGEPDLDSLVDRVQSDTEALQTMVAAIAVPETWLVRYPSSFDLLIERLTELRTQSSSVTMLSAACATGQEALTMVAAACEAGFALPDIEVDAVDINEQAIARAREGYFRPISVREDLPTWARRALRFDEDGSASAREEFLDRVAFVHADLFSWKPPNPLYDAVFFRNLLIYLDPERGRELLGRCVKWLEPRGCLFLGHADPIPMGLGMRRIRRDHAFAFERVAEKDDPERKSSDPTHKMGVAVATSKPSVTSGVLSLEEIEELVRSGRTREALQAVRRLLEGSPMNASAQLLAGTLLLGAGHVEEARQAFERAVHLNPDEDEALIQLAMLAEHNGMHDAASQYRRRAERAFHRRHNSPTEFDQ